MDDKQKQKQLKNLKGLHNLVVSRYNFKDVQTWRSIYECLGFTKEHIRDTYKPEYLNTIPVFSELRAFLNREMEELEARLDGKRAESISAPSQSVSEIPFKPASDYPSDTSMDCTVLALKECLGISYKDAETLMTSEGRQTNKAMNSEWVSEFLFGAGFVLVNREVEPLSKVLSQYPKGKFILRQKNTATMSHLMALVDGVIIDRQAPSLDAKIERVFMWTPHKKADFEKKSDVVLQATQEILKDAEQPVKIETPAVEGLNDEKDYGYVRSPNVSDELFEYWFQKKAAAEAIHLITVKKKRGILVLAPTGTGKTFIEGLIDRHLIDIGWSEGRTWSHIPRLCITKRTVVEQTKRVFKRFLNIDPSQETEVINIEQLRSAGGQLWLKEKVVVENGVDKTIWEWKRNIHPCVVYFDESQGAKNKGSTQSKIIYAYNDIPENTCLVSISATPFTRVSEAQAFAVSTRRDLEHLGFPKGTCLNNRNWPAYASAIASPSKPEDYNQAAVERLMKDLEEYVVRVRGVKPQFSAINGVKIVQFASQEERDFYHSAWERFEAEQAKLAAAKDAGLDTGACQLVILLKFAMAAEFCHAKHFARDMYECWKKGKAPVAAVKFKATLIEIVRIWIEEYGMSRDDISLIWGGGQTQLTTKQKAKEKIKAKADKMKALGIDIDEFLADAGLDDVEDRVIKDYPPEWRLGMQTPDDRQKEIDRFQSGKTTMCIYTLKAGGVGLSLHHCDEMSKIKCRRKKSGYAVEEDIPKVPIRQRETFMVVTYNAIELVQASGRVPRLTSLSPTIQNVYCFAGTIEVEMGRIYTAKFRCLSAVVKTKEDWQDLMFTGNRVAAVEAALSRTKDVANDESTLIDEGDIEEDDEDGENGK